MNYQRIYDQLIQKRVNSPITEGYKERHHIIPRSCGGSNKKSNLVDLTAREHFIAHLLLVKIYQNTEFKYSMIKAFYMMKPKSTSHKERIVNSRWYEIFRKEHSIAMSVLQSGENNSQFGKIWIYNDEMKVAKRVPADEEIPQGWSRGRSSIFKLCKGCNKKFKRVNLEQYCSESCRKNSTSIKEYGKKYDYVCPVYNIRIENYKEYTSKKWSIFPAGREKTINLLCKTFDIELFREETLHEIEQAFDKLRFDYEERGLSSREIKDKYNIDCSYSHCANFLKRIGIKMRSYNKKMDH